MAKTFAQETNVLTDENAELKRAVRECISELELANKRMADRQTRINKLKMETRAMLNQLKDLSNVA